MAQKHNKEKRESLWKMWIYAFSWLFILLLDISRNETISSSSWVSLQLSVSWWYLIKKEKICSLNWINILFICETILPFCWRSLYSRINLRYFLPVLSSFESFNCFHCSNLIMKNLSKHLWLDKFLCALWNLFNIFWNFWDVRFYS
jgi:hypothetical protein